MKVYTVRIHVFQWLWMLTSSYSDLELILTKKNLSVKDQCRNEVTYSKGFHWKLIYKMTHLQRCDPGMATESRLRGQKSGCSSYNNYKNKPHCARALLLISWLDTSPSRLLAPPWKGLGFWLDWLFLPDYPVFSRVSNMVWYSAASPSLIQNSISSWFLNAKVWHTSRF